MISEEERRKLLKEALLSNAGKDIIHEYIVREANTMNLSSRDLKMQFFREFLRTYKICG
jgi:hypothetical protein